MKIFVTGGAGYIGSHAVLELLRAGQEVCSYDNYCNSSPEALRRVRRLANADLSEIQGDVRDRAQLLQAMEGFLPNAVIHFAGLKAVGKSAKKPLSYYDTNVVGTLRLLNAIRSAGLEKATRLYQASTSELYGKVQEIPQKETTPFYPRSPYGVAKQYAYWMLINYREAYGMHLTNGILFNHESPRRGPTFVTRKITRAVARISQGKMKTLYLGNLDAKRDWGHARDYVEGMWLMVQRDEPDDFVLSTGECHSVKEFCEVAFARVGITVQWKGAAGSVDEIGVDAKDPSRVLVKVDPKYFRPTEVDLLVGDCSKAKKLLGWAPKVTFKALAEEMVDADLAELRREIAQEGQ